MKVGNQHFRTIWLGSDGRTVNVIDQRKLPFEFALTELRTVDETASAIREMVVRGAGLIGATAGFGMLLAALEAERMDRQKFLEHVRQAGDVLIATRPTAINLAWAVERQVAAMTGEKESDQMVEKAFEIAQAIADEDAEACRQIGLHGVALIREICRRKRGERVNVLTHCNAGWLAFVDFGSATAPIYTAFDEGIPVHVWVDETRPRNQGARLTAWELGQQGVPHTVIVDSAGGHLMQRGQVDIVITGTDRTTFSGDVANKIGTYLKALAAKDNNVPFYVALPSSTFDWDHADGMKSTPIEERASAEVNLISGRLPDGQIAEVATLPFGTPAKNYGFDVTPARLVTGLITERGICQANAASITELFPDQSQRIKVNSEFETADSADFAD
jgi:methylthioribose-1-phosphate isomerase